MSPPEAATIPVFILCGGLGTRLGDRAANGPKPMVPIGDRPIVWHIMRSYARFGFRRFVLCVGHRGEIVADWFANWAYRTNDFTVSLAERAIHIHQSEPLPDWEVTIAQTGEATMTGGRIARAAARYLGDAPHFAVTYGDGLTDADLGAQLRFHLAHERLGTVLGVHPPSSFGRFELHEERVAAFVEKPDQTDEWINGGYFLFRRGVLEHLSADADCVLEQEPLRRLAALGQIELFRHDGFWSCMDTPKDHDRMQAIWRSGAAPWLG